MVCWMVDARPNGHVPSIRQQWAWPKGPELLQVNIFLLLSFISFRLDTDDSKAILAKPSMQSCQDEGVNASI